MRETELKREIESKGKRNGKEKEGVLVKKRVKSEEW